MRVTVGRHLLLLHRLEQRGLRLRRGAIDLVGEEKIREDGTRLEAEDRVSLVVDRRARDVGGHQVGRELDPREPHRADPRDRTRDERLREPWRSPRSGRVRRRAGPSAPARSVPRLPITARSTSSRISAARDCTSRSRERHLDRLQSVDDRPELVLAAAPVEPARRAPRDRGVRAATPALRAAPWRGPAAGRGRRRDARAGPPRSRVRSGADRGEGRTPTSRRDRASVGPTRAARAVSAAAAAPATWARRAAARSRSRAAAPQAQERQPRTGRSRR